jgi:hypothetical protein
VDGILVAEVALRQWVALAQAPAVLIHTKALRVMAAMAQHLLFLDHL